MEATHSIPSADGWEEEWTEGGKEKREAIRLVLLLPPSGLPRPLSGLSSWSFGRLVAGCLVC